MYLHIVIPAKAGIQRWASFDKLRACPGLDPGTNVLLAYIPLSALRERAGVPVRRGGRVKSKNTYPIHPVKKRGLQRFCLLRYRHLNRVDWREVVDH